MLYTHKKKHESIKPAGCLHKCTARRLKIKSPPALVNFTFTTWKTATFKLLMI